MRSRELRRLPARLGCVEMRQTGSHLVVRCGGCQTVVPVHAGEDIAPGTLRGIIKALTPCLGQGWLENRQTR